MMKDIIAADKQDITRIGMESLLRDTQKVRSIVSAENKKELIQHLASKPDAIVILDYSLFDFASADDLLNVSARFSRAHWLLFSEELSGDFLRRLLFSSEQFSIVSKTSDLDEINISVSHIFRHERFICGKVTNQLFMNQKSNTEKDTILTATEREILKEMGLGKTTKEIAATRNLSFHTVITHRKNIFRKLEVNNVHEATKYAMRAGIIDVAEYYI